VSGELARRRLSGLSNAGGSVCAGGTHISVVVQNFSEIGQCTAEL